MLNFQTSSEDFKYIISIVMRHEVEFPDIYKGKRLEAVMDISMTHTNGCPLKLRDLFMAKSFDFYHDVIGIRLYLDRNTGKLADCFLPRYAQQEAK